ncbi:MAG TPA: tetratricopeptide repeat protein [Azospirillum sp.]|nr:tetratricopeptide repeat protein [Azospirillum sp.]
MTEPSPDALLAAAVERRDERLYRQAIALAPDSMPAFANLGVLLRALGRREEAAACYRRALRLDFGSWIHPYNLGNALAELNRLEAADAAYRAAMACDPARAEVLANRATKALAPQARVEEAARALGRALRLHPGVDALHSMHLYLLQYVPGEPARTVAQAHADWGVRHPDSLPPTVAAPAPRLKIGFVSPDLRAHPVGFFLEPVLTHLDRAGFEATCYAHTGNPDWKTERLQRLADHWVWTTGLDDRALDRQIRADGIHVLIDLAGHTFGNRLAVFAGRPAPVQTTWAGYVGTTGLPAMDYLISDSRQSPPGAESLATEAIVRLPDAYVVWGPPEDAPEPAPPPLPARGAPTFGSFNTLLKLNGAAAGLWARLLTAVPSARLLLRTPQLDDAGTRERVRALFAVRGVDPARLDLRGGLPHREFLAAYADVDVALDPFPYSGGLTTLEALWMGVPVVTLGGAAFCSRHSVTHLTSAGLEGLIAADADAYVATAAGLVADADRLADLRDGLRARLRASPACDAVRFTRGFESALRFMWQRHAAGQPPAGFSLTFG